jgi:uncharacterized protein (DUF1697 family)
MLTTIRHASPARTKEGAVKTYVAMLRGINLGGHKRVAMQDLRALVAALPAQDVQTYVQSGNVVFRSGQTAAALVSALEERIRSGLGLDVTVLLRTEAQLRRVVSGNPFAGVDVAKLHVTFLAEKPARDGARELEASDFHPDGLRVVGQEVYLHCPNGYGRSKLGNTFLERRLGTAATTRNWKTVTALADLAS